MKYSVVSGVLVRNIEDRFVLFRPQTDFFIELNSTAAFIWNLLKKSPNSEKKIVNSFKKEFDVSPKEAILAVNECLIDLVDAKVVFEHD